MKKLFYMFTIAIAIVCTMSLSACKEDTPTTENQELTVSPLSLKFTSAGGSETVTVTGPGWTATPSADWITVTLADGEFTVVVAEAGEARDGSITVKNSFETETVSVSQSAPDADPSITVEPSSLKFEGEGGEQVVTVTSELPWTTEPSDDWITVTKSEDSFSVTVAANPDNEPRDGSIIVGNGVETETITVSQGVINPEITVEPTSLTFTGEGGEQTVAVTSKLRWTAEPSDGWITVTESENSFSVTVAANPNEEPRIGSITIDNGVETETVSIEQGKSLGHRLINAKGAYFTSALNPDMGNFEVYFASYDGNMDLWPDDPSDNGYFMYITFNTTIPEKARNWNIPEGTYPLSPTGGVGTIVGNYFSTCDQVIDGNFSDNYLGIAEGTTITVTGDGVNGYLIEMNIVHDNGTTLKAYYSGAMPMPNYTINSSFTDAVDVTVDTGTLQFYGKQNGQEGYQWRMYLYSAGVSIDNGQMQGTGYCLQSQFTSLEILDGATLPSAIYTIENSTAVNKALYGYPGGATGYAGMWLFELRNGAVVNCGPIVSGYLTVMLSGGEYYIDMFGMDDADNDIKVRFIDSMTPVDMRP